MKTLFRALGAAALLGFAALPAAAQGLSGSGTVRFPPVNATYTVGPTGQFPTVTAAVAALNQQVLPAGSGVTLELQDGVINEPGAVLISSAFAKQIYIQGQHSYSFALNSIVSSSGSAGAWTYVLQLNSVTNIAVGDYLTIYSTSGGTNPTYIAGVWPVTAVNSGSNQVTITTTGHQTGAASGSVAAAVVDNKSILKFTNADGFDIWNGGATLNIYSINVVGDGTVHNGISNEDVGRVFESSVSVYGFGGANILSLYNAEINGALLVSSNSGNGVMAEDGGIIDATGLIVSGNSGNGIEAIGNGAISYGGTSITTGNGNAGVYVATGGTVRASGAVTLYSTGNLGSGVFSDNLGGVNLATLASQNNADADQLQFYAKYGLLSESVAVGGTNSCSIAGTFAWVTDASVAYGSSTRGANITGNGSNAVPAYCDGTHWDFM